LDYLLKTSVSDTSGTVERSILLGKTQNGLIKSITSISTPHNGTTLSTFVSSGIPFLQDMIAVAAVVGNSFYNFDLEQWGFKIDNDENWTSYFKRMQEHPAWGTKNMVSWDVSIQGALEFNSNAIASTDIYYFSFVNSNTIKDTRTGRHVPHKSMSFIIRSNARLMGMKKAYYDDGSSTDSTWYENDGIVNKVSMYGPSTGVNGSDPISNYKESELLIPGQWYVVDDIQMDHKRMVGHGTSKKDFNMLMEKYIKHIKLLKSLPE
jgi:triacylglycerol lipase